LTYKIKSKEGHTATDIAVKANLAFKEFARQFHLNNASFSCAISEKNRSRNV